MADIKFSKRFLIKKGFKIKNVDDILRLIKGKKQDFIHYAA